MTPAAHASALDVRRIHALECEVAELKEQLARAAGSDLAVAIADALALTRLQSRIVAMLYRRAGWTVTYSSLELLWDDRVDVSASKTLTVQLCLLRRRLPPDISIETVWSVGLRLDAASAAAIGARLEAQAAARP